MCPFITTLQFLDLGEPRKEDYATWSAGLSLISPLARSVGISDWNEPSDALVTATRPDFIETACITSNDLFHVHPAYTLLSNLRGLTLDLDISADDWQTLAFGCPKLQDLYVTVRWILEHHRTIDDFVLFPALLTFSLVFPPGARKQDRFRVFLPETDMPSLQKFTFCTSDFPANNMVEVALRLRGMKHLEVLELKVVEPLDLRGIISQLPGLIVLSVRSSFRWFDLVDEDLRTIRETQHRLKELCIEQSPSGSDCTHGMTCTLSGFLQLASHPYGDGLERLIISVCAMGDCDFNGAFTTLPSLRSLRFQHLEVDVGMQAAFATLLARFCPNLQSLSIQCFYLRGTYQVTSSALFEEMFWIHQRRVSPPSWICTTNSNIPSTQSHGTSKPSNSIQ
ncbi:hypothetical protein FRB95_014120 [Tulasnella sp. JGI-2019a]|nr:hypothetical protein FRB95_014120 [Tulasnella sp. JGI-2019a]